MMKIIIDIPKKVYDQICDQNLDGIMATAIRCGKPLLKDTLPSAQPEPCDDPRADVYYLAEKIGIHQLYALVVELRGEPARPERKKGRWINYKDEHCCSICDQVIIEDYWDGENRYDYCPYCGSDMRGEE